MSSDSHSARGREDRKRCWTFDYLDDIYWACVLAAGQGGGKPGDQGEDSCASGWSPWVGECLLMGKHTKPRRFSGEDDELSSVKKPQTQMESFAPQTKI